MTVAVALVWMLLLEPSEPLPPAELAATHDEQEASDFAEAELVLPSDVPSADGATAAESGGAKPAPERIPSVEEPAARLARMRSRAEQWARSEIRERPDQPPEATTMTTVDGSFSLCDLPGGTWCLDVCDVTTGRAFELARREVALEPGSSLDARFEGTTGALEVCVTRGGRSGGASPLLLEPDAEHGGVPGFDGHAWSLVPDLTGNARMPRLTPGAYSVASVFLPKEKRAVRIEAGELASLRIDVP